MKNIHIVAASIVISLGLLGCGKPVPLNVKLKAAQPQTNIFAKLDNNDATFDYVLVRKTVSYLNPADSINIADASVLVKDESGNSWLFDYSGQEGIYLPPSSYTGVEPGKTYYLEVNHRGKLYEAKSTVQKFSENNANPMVKDSVEKRTATNGLGDWDTVGYRVITYIKDATQWKNNYYLDVTRNDTLLVEDDGSVAVYAFDDQFFSGKDPNGVPLPITYVFRPEDKVRLDIYAFDEEAFQFYSSMSLQANNGGTIFDGPPANIVGNISNGALGYFIVAASYSDTLTVKRKQ